MRQWLSPDGTKQLFQKKEFLTGQQVMGYWSHYAAKVRENAAAARREATDRELEIPIDEYRRDPTIPTIADELTDAIGTDICQEN